jgi:hypothetical protein
VYHPQSNGAVERANGIIFTGIKKNITDMPRGKWTEELPRVIWSHNTTESRTTKFSPFKLLYGEETMVPEEVKLQSVRTQGPPDSEDMRTTIDTAEEAKAQALQNIEKYQDETRKWKSKKVRRTSIATGDMVLRKKTRGVGKLQDKWDGPFVVTETRPGAYRLQALDGEEDPYSWNQDMLRKYWVQPVEELVFSLRFNCTFPFTIFVIFYFKLL